MDVACASSKPQQQHEEKRLLNLCYFCCSCLCSCCCCCCCCSCCRTTHKSFYDLLLLLYAEITLPFAQICEPLLLTGRPPPPLQLRVAAPATAAAGSAPSAAGAVGRRGKGGVDLSLVFFDVRKADIFMLGVLLFYTWADGAVWGVSDASQDIQ